MVGMKGDADTYKDKVKGVDDRRGEAMACLGTLMCGTQGSETGSLVVESQARLLCSGQGWSTETCSREFLG